MGRSVFVSPSRAELAVEAHAERVAGPGWHVGISVSTEDGSVAGHRDFWSQELSCAAIAESAALAIALMIDPDAKLRPESAVAPPTTPAALESAPPIPSVASVPVRTSDLPPPATWRGSFEIATGVSSGLLPGLAPVAFMRARAIDPSSRWGLEFEGSYFFEQQVDLRANTGAAFTLLRAGIALCALPWGASRVSALVCAGAGLGSMGVRGYGFVDTSPKSQNLMVDLAGRARLVFRLQEHLIMLIGGDLFIPLRRDFFEAVAGARTQELFRPSAVAAGIEVGLAYEFCS